MKRLLVFILCLSMILFSADIVKAYTDPATISLSTLQTALSKFEARCNSNFASYISDGAYYYVFFRADSYDQMNVSGVWQIVMTTVPYVYMTKVEGSVYGYDFQQLWTNGNSSGRNTSMTINSTSTYDLPTSLWSGSPPYINLEKNYVAYSSVEIKDTSGNVVHEAIPLTGTYWGKLTETTPTPTPTVTPTPTPTTVPDDSDNGDDNSSLIDGLINGIKDIFIPDPTYFDTKFNEIRDRFKWTDSVVQIFQNTIGALVVSDEPPVIKINGKSGTALNFGEVVLMDFSWYEPYRNTVNNLLSAIIYLFYFWNLYKRLPDIISGVGMITIYDSKIQNYNDNKKSNDD